MTLSLVAYICEIIIQVIVCILRKEKEKFWVTLCRRTLIPNPPVCRPGQRTWLSSAPSNNPTNLLEDTVVENLSCHGWIFYWICSTIFIKLFYYSYLFVSLLIISLSCCISEDILALYGKICLIIEIFHSAYSDLLNHYFILFAV